MVGSKRKRTGGDAESTRLDESKMEGNMLNNDAWWIEVSSADFKQRKYAANRAQHHTF
jgi:hypothetical protein